MKKIIITNRLNQKPKINNCPHYFISSRKLTQREVKCARKYSIKRYNLKSLSELQRREFFKEYDKFWDSVIKDFHYFSPFWRMEVSSKMQEWEESASYLLLILYTLTNTVIKNDLVLILICSSIEEEDMCKKFMVKEGWNIINFKKSKYFYSMQNLKSYFRFFYFVFYAIRKKIECSVNYQFSDKLKKNKKTIICSLFYNNNISDQLYVDPYFGTLHEYLQKNKKDSIYLAAPIDRGRIKKYFKTSNVYIPYALLKWLDIIKLFKRLFFRKVKIKNAVFFGVDCSDLLNWNIKRWKSYLNFHAEIFYEATKVIYNNFNIDNVIILFEGNSFERACIQGFKEKSKKINIIGYSHAVIYDANMKLHLSKEEKTIRPEPNAFIVPGFELKKLLNKVGRRDSEKIFESCSLRYIPRLLK